jgi:RNA polymerase sigma factor (sigma-70 family)
MASTEAAIGRDLQRLFDGGASAGLTDAQLLDRIARRDDLAGAAFEAILTRHGSSVLACCRRVLGDSAAAEDAFQATFLVLFRRAGSIRVEGSLAPWILHVARLTALKAREGEVRRRARELRAARPEALAPEEDASDLHLLVRTEVDRLPGKYRDPVRLCYFEGRTHDDAAADLGWPVGTVRGRLSRAREMLRTRLERRGIGISSMSLAAALSAGGDARAEIPQALREATLAAAARGGAVKAGVAALAAVVARALVRAAAWKLAAAVLVVISLISAGAGLVAMAGRDDGPGRQQGPPDGETPARARTPAVDRYGDPLPKGAVARLGTTRFRHREGFPRVYFAPDGKTLVTARGEARIWDAATGRLLRSFDAGWEVVPSPDGGTLFAVGRGFLRAIDGPTGRELRRVALDPKDNPNRLAISPDGKALAVLLAFQSQRRQQKDLSILILFDADTLAVRWRIEKEPPYAEELAFSPDGRRLAIVAPAEGARSFNMMGPKASTIRLLDVAAGAELRQIPVEGFGVGSLAFSPDGTMLAAGVGDRTIRLYDPATGQERLPRLGRERAVPPSPEGNGNLKGYGATKGFEEGKARQPSCLAFSPDGKMLASGLEDLGYYGGLLDVAPITLWDVATAREVCRLAGHVRGITSLAFSPDGKTLASAGGADLARIWDVATGREVDHRPGHPGGIGHTGIHSLVVSPVDGTVFTSGGADGLILHWDPSDGRPLEAVGVKPSMVDSLAISSDGRALFVSDPDGGPVLWDLAGRRELHRLTRDRLEGGRNFRPTFIAGGRRVDPRYFHVVFSPDGRTAAAGNHVWDLAAGRLLVALPSSCFAAAYSADGRRLFTLDRDGVRTWDATTGEERRRPIPVPYAGGTAEFSPDGRLVAIGCVAPRTPGSPNPGDRLIDPIRVWELASGREVASLLGHTDSSNGLAFSPDGQMLSSVNGAVLNYADPGLRIWDVASGKPLRRFKLAPHGAHQVAFLPNGRSIVTAGDDGTALVWDVSDLADRRPPEPPDGKALEALWSDLVADDARRAHRASWSLGVDGAVPFLRARLRAGGPADSARVDASRGPITDPETLRTLRAIAALERIGSPQAREVLEDLERSDGGASTTRDAAEALLRLSRKKAHSPGGAAAR